MQVRLVRRETSEAAAALADKYGGRAAATNSVAVILSET